MIDLGYLDALVSGLKIAREIGQANVLALWRAEEVLPGPDAQTAIESYFHPVGTCRIGTDPMAVVDPELRVHGISGLRVADGSVLPSPLCVPLPSASPA